MTTLQADVVAEPRTRRRATARARGRPRRPAATALLRPVRGRLRLGALLSAVGACAGLVPFVAVAEIGRELLGAGVTERGRIWAWVGIGIAGAAARLALLVVAAEISHHADADLQRAIRSRVARHLGVLPLGWFSTRGSAEVKKAMSDDVEDLHHLVAHVQNDLASAVVMPLAAVGYLLAVDWRMTIVTLVPIVAATFSLRASMTGYSEKVESLTLAQRRINAATIEYVDGIQVVKAFGQEGRAFGRFSAAVDDFCDQLREWSAEVTGPYLATMVLLAPPTMLLVVLSGGTALVAADWIEPVDLLPFLLVGVGLPVPLTMLGDGIQQLRRARLAAGHLADVLEAPALAEADPPSIPKGSDVELDSVSVCYDGRAQALTDVTATLPAGTVTAVVGPSGSGKTTLARAVARYFDVDTGTVRLGGVDVRQVATRDLLRRISMVFQDIVLVRDTMRENIRLGRPEATDDEVEAAARVAQIHEVIQALPAGYDTVLGEDGGQLSGGERQRITIARAILQDAPVVILDEATASVDPENEAAVHDALAALLSGRTVLVIAHRLHTVADADQILVLDHGRVVERGNHAELLAADGLYARMWRAQERHHTNDPEVVQ